jgi:hypothetical protein
MASETPPYMTVANRTSRATVLVFGCVGMGLHLRLERARNANMRVGRAGVKRAHDKSVLMTG